METFLRLPETPESFDAGRDILNSGGVASRETIRAIQDLVFKFIVLPNDGSGYPLGRIVHVDALAKKNAFNVEIMTPVGLSGRSELDKLKTWFRCAGEVDISDRMYLALQIAAAKMRNTYSTMVATLRVKRQAGAIEVKASKRQRALPVDDDEDLLASALGDAIAACRSNPAKSGRRFIGREPIKMVGAIGAMKKYAAYGKPPWLFSALACSDCFSAVPGSSAKIAEENMALTQELQRIKTAVAGGGYACALFQAPAGVEELQHQLQRQKQQLEAQHQILLREQQERQKAELEAQQLKQHYEQELRANRERQDEVGLLGSPVGGSFDSWSAEDF